MRNTFFCFGHGFGGTHTFSHVLNLHERTDCKHERKYDNSKFALFDSYKKVWFGESDGIKEIKEEREKHIKQCNKPYWGEANGILGFFVEAIDKVFVEAKFIFTHRDPRKQIISAFNTGIFDRQLGEQIGDPWWWPTPDPKDSVMNKRWNSLNGVEKCAWFWAEYNKFVLQQLENIPDDRKFIIPFEKMVKGELIQECFDFLGLPRVDEATVTHALNFNKAKTAVRAENPVESWDALDEKTKKTCVEFIKDTAEKLGYEV